MLIFYYLITEATREMVCAAVESERELVRVAERCRGMRKERRDGRTSCTVREEAPPLAPIPPSGLHHLLIALDRWR